MSPALAGGFPTTVPPGKSPRPRFEYTVLLLSTNLDAVGPVPNGDRFAFTPLSQGTISNSKSPPQGQKGSLLQGPQSPVARAADTPLCSLGFLGCTPQAYKACACPDSRPKQEPRVSNRDINSLMDGGAYTSEAGSWSDTPPCAADDGQAMVAIFAPRGKGRLPVTGILTSGGLISH